MNENLAENFPEKDDFLNDFDLEQLSDAESFFSNNLEDEIIVIQNAELNISPDVIDHLGYYIKEIPKTPLLTREQEFWFSVEVQANNYPKNLDPEDSKPDSNFLSTILVNDFQNNWKNYLTQKKYKDIPEYDWGSLVSDIVIQKLKGDYKRPDTLHYWISQYTSKGDPGREIVRTILNIYLALLNLPQNILLQIASEFALMNNVLPHEFPLVNVTDFTENWNRCDIIERASIARETLVISNLRLVISIANKYKGQGLAFEDLIQYGNLGLMRAIDKYDPATGYRFSTYSYFWIKQAITRAIADFSRPVRFPVHLHDQIHQVMRVRDQLHQKLNHPPTDEEIAAEHGKISAEKVREIIQIAREPLSLDEPMNKSRDSFFGEFIPDEFDTEQLVVATILHENMQNTLKLLDPREQDIIKLRYGFIDDEPRTLDEIGKMLGVTRERVRQLERKALDRLRHPTRRRFLRDFLS
jgi:RNA polymerase sigma factor (sigma-70 family)